MVTHISVKVWQAADCALESANQKNFNEGTLHSGVTAWTRAPLVLNRQGAKSITRTQREPQAIKKGCSVGAVVMEQGSYRAQCREGTGEKINSHLPSLSSRKCLPLAEAAQEPAGKGALVHGGWPPGRENRQGKAENRSEKQTGTGTRGSSKTLSDKKIRPLHGPVI